MSALTSDVAGLCEIWKEFQVNELNILPSILHPPLHSPGLWVLPPSSPPSIPQSPPSPLPSIPPSRAPTLDPSCFMLFLFQGEVPSNAASAITHLAENLQKTVVQNENIQELLVSSFSVIVSDIRGCSSTPYVGMR